MNKQDWENKKQELTDAGYKVYGKDSYGNYDFHYCKTIKDNDGQKLYVIDYRFWNYEKLQRGAGYAVDTEIMLTADIADVYANFTTDANCSVEEMEDLATNYFLFCTKNKLTNYGIRN